MLIFNPAAQLAFAIHENRGVFAVLLGSGLSRSAGIPTGWEITLDLIRRMAISKGIKNIKELDCARWYREQTEKEPDYSDLLNEVSNSQAERQAILQHYIEPDEEDLENGRKTPTPAHHAIAKLVAAGYIRVIITTNFDRLMENALREQHVEPTIIDSADKIKGIKPLVHSRCTVFKLHGDYQDTRILNTDEELKKYPPRYNKLLDRIFDEYGLIVCGWSGNYDVALCNAFRRAPCRRYPIYWAIRGQLKPESHAQKLINHRGAKAVQIVDADKFFITLHETIEVIEQYQPQNPISVELLISSTKRYLAKPEYRIQLDELFAQEAERLLAQIDESTFTAESDFDVRVQRYESMTEPLACMSGVLGRWGDGTEFNIVLDLLRNLCRPMDKAISGVMCWQEIRDYPAVLIFTAYGIGLTRAARWKTLFKLFSRTLTSTYYHQKNIVSTLFLEAWDGGSKQFWQKIESHKNPLSEHLLKVMTNWQKAFARGDTNFALLCGRFEMLGSLAYFHQYHADMENLCKKEVELQNKRDKSTILARMPMGRAASDDALFPILLQETMDKMQFEKLKKAGFTKDKINDRFFRLFIENFRRHRYKS